MVAIELIEQQSPPAPAGFRSRGHPAVGREHRAARAAPAGGGPPGARSLPAGGRRAAARRGQAGRLDRRAGAAWSRPTIGRRPSWPSSRTCSARTSTPLEKAASFQRYLEQYGCTQEDLAGRLKLDRSTIANLIRLLELPAAGARRAATGQDHAGPCQGPLPLGEEREQIEFCRAHPRRRD